MTTRDDLLATLRRERENVERLVAEVGIDRMNEPNVEGHWSVRDLLAHLSDWRLYVITRLEAARRGEQPTPPWPADIEAGDFDAINAWLDERSRHKSVDDIQHETRDAFDRLERIIGEMSDEELFTPGRIDWNRGQPLGPWAVDLVAGHFQEHEPAVRAWLERSEA
jgi:hypothetical protein